MGQKLLWWIFVILCTLVSLYPLSYFVIERTFGLLGQKPAGLLEDLLWNIAFYLHIIPGGIALAVGWSQFWTSLRKKNISLHRTIGKIYVIAAIASGLGGLYLSFFATGGLVSIIGFFLLAIIWLYSTITAYTSIKVKNIRRHENMMILSYAACFGAVTLRFWLPILITVMGSFDAGYRIVAWLSWVPNIIVALMIINNKKNKLA